MNEIEQLRADMETMLMLVTQTLCETADARRVLQSVMHNLDAISTTAQATPGVFGAGQKLLLVATSAALKRHPGDPDVLAAYQGLRSQDPH